MTVDIPTREQAKRWLLQCYRPIRWDSLEDVGEAFREVDLVLANMDFRVMEGTIEFRFIANRLTEETYAHFDRITRRHGGQVVDIRCEVEHNVKTLEYGGAALRYGGPSEASVTAIILPPRSHPRGLIGETMAALAAERARVFERYTAPRIDLRGL